MRHIRGVLAFALLAGACGDDGGTTPGVDGGVSTAHCTYQDVPANAGTGTPVAAAPLMAGAAEVALDVPVGTTLGGYTARGSFIGTADTVDNRVIAISGGFFPSVGIETRPKAKALALRAGGETVVWLKVDAIFAYEGFVFELENRLGAEYRGKIMLSTSHSHSAWAQYTANSPLKVGASELRQIVYDRFLAACEAAARGAIADLQPAKIGFFADAQFDPGDVITRERRGENDELPGGNRKDDVFHLIRVDSTDGQPIAIVPVYGVHGTLNGEENPLASTDAVGGMERMVEEQFDHQVVVMHVQSAGADTSPAGHGGNDCGIKPGEADDPCFGWMAAEGHGRLALDTIMQAWTAAGTAMSEQLALSMVTRSVELGPDPSTFSIRGGALTYAPFDLSRRADQVVYDGSHNLVSPIDEFNAPVGAALCEADTALFPAAAMPNVEGLIPYGSCVRIDEASLILGQILDLDFPDLGPDKPACSTTRTTLSALRLGDYLVASMPGELSVLLADKVRAVSPVDAPHTIAIGYSQGHVGYMMTPEDWVLGGYEPSITFWGPLESEYLVERLAELMPLAIGSTRADGAAGGANRIVPPTVVDDLPIDDPAPMRGTVPATVPADLWMRADRPATAQPAPTVPRVSGLATFIWLGDDSMTKTPIVTLEQQTGVTWAPVTRHSGRLIDDGDLLLVYAPSPLIRVEGQAQQHLWAVEWQPVPWTGAAGGRDALDQRGALPLGTYRFHVEGSGWTLSSDPFEVTPAPLAVAATRVGAVLGATVSLHAPKGYRLMDLSLPSNRAVPLRGKSVSVVGRNAAGTPVGTAFVGTTDASGHVVLDFGAAGSTVVRIDVTDADGNTGMASL